MYIYVICTIIIMVVVIIIEMKCGINEKEFGFENGNMSCNVSQPKIVTSFYKVDDRKDIVGDILETLF